MGAVGPVIAYGNWGMPPTHNKIALLLFLDSDKPITLFAKIAVVLKYSMLSNLLKICVCQTVSDVNLYGSDLLIYTFSLTDLS